MIIEQVSIEENDRDDILVACLTDIWHRSVKATHLFLSDEDINNLIPFVNQGLKEIDILIVLYVNSQPVGFMGIQTNKIEMLFLDTAFMKKGYGKRLIKHAIDEYNVEFVDVNEQNPNAVKFYKKMGFYQFDRAEFDEQGNKFPILKMKLTQ